MGTLVQLYNDSCPPGKSALYAQGINNMVADNRFIQLHEAEVARGVLSDKWQFTREQLRKGGRLEVFFHNWKHQGLKLH